MALTDENGSGMIMPVQPMGYGGGYSMPYAVPMYGGYGNNGFGFGGGDWGGLLVLFLFAAMFGGFGGGWGGNGWGNENMFPWLMTGQAGINANTNAGFDNAAIGSQLSGIQTSLTTGFSNAEVAGCNRAMDAMQTAYTNQIADLNRSFDSQTALATSLNGIQSQLAKCCCDNELATANLSALVQRENCADREALSNGIRDIISSQTAGTQRILDQLCNDKIDAKNERIVSLENQITMQNLAASQAMQTAQLIADNNAQTQALINRIAPYPQPSFIVGNPYFSGYYGNNGYWNNGCGCNGGNF